MSRGLKLEIITTFSLIVVFLVLSACNFTTTSTKPFPPYEQSSTIVTSPSTPSTLPTSTTLSTSSTTPPTSSTTPPTTNITVNVKITKIFYDGIVYRTESDEYVEITNLGDESVNLLGWVLKDISEGYPSFTFPSYELQPNQVIRVYTNEIHLEYGGFSFGYGKAIWNNTSPDTAALFNAEGIEVSRLSY